MFALWSNDFQPIDTEILERYVHWEVSMIEKFPVNGDPYVAEFKRHPLKFHKCNEKDNDYVDFVEHQKGAEVFLKEMNCLD